jgi:hypothetical protein
MSDGTLTTWISDGEKYALVGLTVKTEGAILSGKVSANLWTLVDASFKMPSNWREWLGSIRADEVGDCNLFLFSKQASQTPEILDAKNKRLEQLASNFYTGLLLASTFAPAHRPVLLSGSRRAGEIDVRQQHDFDVPIPRTFHPYPAVVAKDVQWAAHLAESLDALATAPLEGGHWRLFRTLSVYTEARSASQIIDRIHQYSRCVDGVILPDIGKTKQQFRSRTELFIGPSYHQLMGEIYDVRSDVEHLHEYRYLEIFDREVRLELVRKEAIIEHIARTVLARIIGDPRLWPYFANTSALEAFWALQPSDRQQIWGNPFDPNDALAEFDPTYLHNGRLGA